MTQSRVLKSASLPEYFREQVTEAVSTTSAQVSPEAEFYLVNLLTAYSQAGNLAHQESPLALQLFSALEAGHQQRIPILKKMGDASLYISGFFSESLNHKLVDVDYYMKMGHLAYSSVANLINEEPPQNLKTLYAELATNFIDLTDVLSVISTATQTHSPKDILRLYEKWLKTGSKHAEELLNQEGIIPSANLSTKPIQ